VKVNLAGSKPGYLKGDIPFSKFGIDEVYIAIGKISIDKTKLTPADAQVLKIFFTLSKFTVLE